MDRARTGPLAAHRGLGVALLLGWLGLMAGSAVWAQGTSPGAIAPATASASASAPEPTPILTPTSASARPAGPAGYVPDGRFLKDDPYRKTKQVVRLSGVQSDADLAVVRGAINDVVGFVRLFGISGSNLGNATISGVSPERMADIKAAKVTWKAFEDRSTPAGRQAMPLEPASGHMVHHMGDWSVESPAALSVVVDFRMTSYELRLVKDPVPRVLRLRFVNPQGRWLFDGAQAL